METEMREAVLKAGAESTCSKRSVVFLLHDEYENIIACESNRCETQGSCARLNLQSINDPNYDKDNLYPWIHAEIRTLRAMPDMTGRRMNRVAYLFGHDFVCPHCVAVLEYETNLSQIIVFPRFPGVGYREMVARK